MSYSMFLNKQIITIVAVFFIICSSSLEAKLLGRSRYYEDSFGGYDSPYAGATGERAILTIRGTRNPYDGSAPSKLIIEDNSYRGPYPRGVYDRLDSGHNHRMRMPYYPNQDFGYGGYRGIKRRDFLDPDFGLKTSVKLVGGRGQANKCRFDSEVNSEIPKLGLDTGRLNIDCDINPTRMADVAIKAARNYGKYRLQRQQAKTQPHRSSSNLKRKKTRINIQSEYEHDHENHPVRASSNRNNDDDDDVDED